MRVLNGETQLSELILSERSLAFKCRMQNKEIEELKRENKELREDLDSISFSM